MFQRWLTRRTLAVLVIGILALVSSGRPAAAESYSTVTIAEDFQMTHLIVVCRMVARPDDSEKECTFEVTETLKGADRIAAAQAGAKTPYRFQAHCFDKFPVNATRMAFGNVEGGEFTWGRPFEVTKRSIDYVRRSPHVPASGPERIAAFIPYLEDEEPLLAIDAHQELVNSGLAEWRKARDILPRTKLLAWIADPKVPIKYRRLYLALLGVCGTSDDIPAVRALIESNDQKTLELLDAALACYLQLAGEAGLPLVEESILKNASREYREIYAAIMALRYTLQQPTTIPQARIVAAIRLVLDRPDIADLVVPDLTRLKDWESAPRIMELFRTAKDDNDTRWIRLPAVNFMRASPRADAKEYLAEMRKLDPEVVKRSEEIWPNVKP